MALFQPTQLYVSSNKNRKLKLIVHTSAFFAVSVSTFLCDVSVSEMFRWWYHKSSYEMTDHQQPVPLAVLMLSLYCYHCSKLSCSVFRRGGAVATESLYGHTRYLLMLSSGCSHDPTRSGSSIARFGKS